MEIFGTIYIITNKHNSKQYVGQALSHRRDKDGYRIHGSSGRFRQHCNDAKNKRFKCPLLEKAIAKYGIDSFTLDTLLVCNVEHLNCYEKIFIKGYNTIHPYGYNLDTGGGNGRIVSNYTREKMSKSRKGITDHFTEEVRKKLSEAHIGKIHTQKTREKMSNTRQGCERDIPNNRSLPKYISLYSYGGREGYQVSYGFGKERKHKKFLTKSLTMPEKLQLAIDYLSLQRSPVGEIGNLYDGSRYSLVPLGNFRV